jgi:hypothetical protein
MWCTACKTGFNYATGELLKGTNTNPHYAQWRNEQGLPVVSPECPQVNEAGVEMDLLLCKVFALGLNLPEAALVHDFFLLVDPNQDPFPELEQKEDVEDKKVETSSDRYLLDLLGKKDYVDTLYHRHRFVERRRQIQAVVNLLRAGGEELISKMMEAGSKEEGKTVLQGMLNLRLYVNQCLRDVDKALGYSSTETGCISERFNSYTNQRDYWCQRASEKLDDYNRKRYPFMVGFQIAVLGNGYELIPDKEAQYRALVQGLANHFGMGGDLAAGVPDVKVYNFNYYPLVKAHLKKAEKGSPRRR